MTVLESNDDEQLICRLGCSIDIRHVRLNIMFRCCLLIEEGLSPEKSKNLSKFSIRQTRVFSPRVSNTNPTHFFSPPPCMCAVYLSLPQMSRSVLFSHGILCYTLYLPPAQKKGTCWKDPRKLKGERKISTLIL